MGRLALQFFGSVRAYREREADVPSVGQKAYALLAYLALNPKQPCTRALAATLLWGDRGEEQAHSSLRQTVWSLRKSLNDESASILISDGDRLTLNSEAVTVDVHAFERLSGANTRESLEQARALYVGEFLEGIDVKSPGFEEWVASERLRLHDLAADVMERLSQLYIRSGEWHAALGTAKQLLALDPLHEEGHRILMRTYDRSGRRSLALRQYRICESTMRRELDTAPAPETVALYSDIRARNGVGIAKADQIGTTAAGQPDPQPFEPAATPEATTSAALADATTAIASPGRAGRGAWFWAAALAAAALVLVSGGLGLWLLAPSLPDTREASPIAATAPPRLSIVVLPLVNLSNDPEQEYFADGLTSNLTTDVAQIDGSFVIAANTAFTYKGKAIDAREIGRDLGVRYVLEGSVERSANQIRVNAQLVEAERGSHLWAEAFNRERGDLFAIEDEITARIARTLHLQLIQIEAERAERRGISADAMDYIMRGDALWLRPVSKDNYRALEEMYGRALQLDESLPRALTSMAYTLSRKVLDDVSHTPEDDLRRAEELVSPALDSNPNYAFAHHTKGQILRARRRFEEAIVEYQTEIALDPMSVGGLQDLARAEILVGEPEKAIPLLEQAMRISPRDPDIGYMHWRLGLANLLLGNTDEAMRWTEKSVLTFYDTATAYLHLAAELGLKGDKAAAQAALAQAIKRNSDYSTISGVRSTWLSNRPKYVELAEQTVIEGLRKAGLPE